MKMSDVREFKVIPKKQYVKELNLDEKKVKIFCDISVTSPPAGTKRRGKYCPDFFRGGLLKEEAEQLYEQLGKVLGKCQN